MIAALKRLAIRLLCRNKFDQSRRLPIDSSKVFLDFKDESGIPANLPSPRELRVLALHLEQTMPPTEALSLAQAKRYELIHELAGYHDAIASIRNVADVLEEAERTAQDEAQILPRAE